MSIRTPLARVRGLGSAKTGTGHWWVQRLTAISNLPLVIFLIAYVLSHLGASRAEIVASMQNPFVALGVSLAMISIFWHMRLGMQVIIEDYVHSHGMKIALLVVNTFFPLAMAATAIYAILKMSFGT